MSELSNKRLRRLGIEHQFPELGIRLLRVQNKTIEHNLERVSEGNLYQTTGEYTLEKALKKSGLLDYLEKMERAIARKEEESEW